MSHYTEIGGQASARNGEVCPIETRGLASGICDTWVCDTWAGNAMPASAMPAPEEPGPAISVKAECLGKLMVRRCRPRRLDKRVVARRPMMLVKRRLVAPLPQKLFGGREIIART